MTTLKAADLEFAKEHISAFYDSDFFPKPIDFEALWHNWEEVKADLISRNIQKLTISTPRILSAPKPGITYRVVHQLEPLDALVYTALASSVCDQVEDARPLRSEHVACSYRISKSAGSFFSSGTGWKEFTDRTEELAEEFGWALSFDISDFYNQIYLHRLNNALEIVDPSLKDVAADIEAFITAMNSKTSQGVPVGPAASIVLAEAVLMDVDKFISDSGLKHTRYVDDFRVFADSQAELDDLLSRVTMYLYEVHRLSIATEKTVLTTSGEFIDSFVNNEQSEERDEILESLEEFGPYSQYEEDEDDYEYGEDEMGGDPYGSYGDDTDDDDGWAIEEVSDSQAAANDALKVGAILLAAEKLQSAEKLDLGVARALVRTARRAKASELAPELVENLCFYAPIASDVFIYLDSISDQAFLIANSGLFEAALSEPCLKNEFVAYWFTWYCARNVTGLASAKIRKYVFDSEWLELVAIAAVSEGNVPWVRNLKSKWSNYGPRERRAIIYASKVLPHDERKAWLQNVVNNAATKFDAWMAKWVLAGAPESPL